MIVTNNVQEVYLSHIEGMSYCRVITLWYVINLGRRPQMQPILLLDQSPYGNA